MYLLSVLPVARFNSQPWWSISRDYAPSEIFVLPFCRDVRSQLEAMEGDMDMIPDEYDLIISDADLQSSQQKEIVRLQTEMHRLKMNQV